MVVVVLLLLLSLSLLLNLDHKILLYCRVFRAEWPCIREVLSLSSSPSCIRCSRRIDGISGSVQEACKIGAGSGAEACETAVHLLLLLVKLPSLILEVMLVLLLSKS
uniref:Secreted protein n=1 Tax=Opuntia streptacantha TaxID=393608 RepID=A0A7C9D691_OPUST